MSTILITTTNEKQINAAVAWDPLAGNPVASFTGEMPGKMSISKFSGGIACSTTKRPYIQTWNFQSSCSSGCLIGILDGSHSARIGELKLNNWESFGPTFLVSSDATGFVACWSLGHLVDELNFLSNRSVKEDSSHGKPVGNSDTHCSQSKQSPIWYIIQASHGQPLCDFLHKIVLICGSQGLKIYDLYTGTPVGSLLTEVVGGIHSLSVSISTGSVYCGTNGGLLYTTHIFPFKGLFSADKEPRHCFADSDFTAVEKTIVCTALSSDFSLLVVGSKCGLIEILRPNSLLTCLQRFSILNPSNISNTESTKTTFQLTGLCLISRPDWLSVMGGGGGVKQLEFSTKSKTNNEWDANVETNSISDLHHLCPIEPLKRHFGWHLDDSVRIHSNGSCKDPNAYREQAETYMDDFYSMTNLGNGMKIEENSQSELDALRREIDQVVTSNRELLRRLVDYELRS